MIVIAKTVTGKELFHSVREMYEVPKTSASLICDVMNKRASFSDMIQTFFKHNCAHFFLEYMIDKGIITDFCP